MAENKRGRSSFLLPRPPVITAWAQCGREEGEPGASGPLLRQNQPGYLFRSKDLGAGGEGHAGAGPELAAEKGRDPAV